MSNYPDPLRVLDLSQTRAAAVIASVSRDQMFLPTPCDLWDVKDVINKLVASTRLFTGFGLRQPADPSLVLINPSMLTFTASKITCLFESACFPDSVLYLPLLLMYRFAFLIWFLYNA